MTTVLITGATGFIGYILTNYLHDKGYKVRVFVRDPTKQVFHEDIIVVKGHLLDTQAIHDAVKDTDIIIHVAAVINSPHKQDYIDANITGTQRLVDQAKQAKVKRFIYISTCDAYFDPTGWYGGSKLEGERIVKASGVPYVTLRPNVVYGKGAARGMLKLIRLIKRSPVVPIIGSGNTIIQPIYIDDLCAIIEKACTTSVINQTYDVAGPTAITYNQLIDIITKKANVKRIKLPIPLFLLQPIAFLLSRITTTTWNEKKIAKIAKDKPADITKLKEALGITPRSIEDGLTLFINEEFNK